MLVLIIYIIADSKLIGYTKNLWTVLFNHKLTLNFLL